MEQSELVERTQRPDQPVSLHIKDMREKCANLNLTANESILHFVRGLKNEIKNYVIGCNPPTLKEVIERARLGESMAK